MSKLLAERGAAIVDADQIARDLQAPGTPVVAAMAERFGRQILDVDGALIRPEVAKIVFSDKEALKDLNGIVHPAMQAEIQRQIDMNSDTDRIVVLDFPLLGENPRRGLAATVVVDIPYELAVVRAVDRGMDEDDVRNRINSQVTREKRLETATHVIDNSGDLIDLVAQVDRLWSELQTLPPTVATDVGEPEVESAHDIDRGGDTVWIFGYGSLVDPASMARTIGRTAVRGVDFFEADLVGWGRRWNYGVMHVIGTWTRADGVEIDNGTIVALGLVASATDATMPFTRSVAGDELVNLDRRERNYDRVDISDLVTVTGAGGEAVSGSIFTYVPNSASVAEYERARDAGTAGIRQTYWDLVDEAFTALGAEHASVYRSSTPAPDVPVVDLRDARDR